MGEKLSDIKIEYINTINDILGFYLDTVYGDNYLLKLTKKVQDQSSSLLNLSVDQLDTINMSYGEGDPNDPDSEVFHYSTQGDFKRRIDKGGNSRVRIGQTCISQVYQYWEDNYRERVAISLNEPKNDIKLDILGDLRILRNSIIHNGGTATFDVYKCKKIKLFNPGDEVKFTQKEIIGIISQVKSDVNSL